MHPFPSLYQKLQKDTFSAVFLPDLRSGWNVGAFFRTADALGINHVFLSGFTPYPPHKEISKTALGADEYVDWSYHLNPDEVLDFLQKNRVDLISVELTKEAKPLQDFQFSKKTCLIMGNEISGVPKKIQQKTKNTVFIPMHGKKDSLNVSIAGAIAMWEMRL